MDEGLTWKPCENPSAAVDVTFHQPFKSYNHSSLETDFHAMARIQPATSDVHLVSSRLLKLQVQVAQNKTRL